MKKYLIPMFLIVLMLLSACGGTADQPPAEEPEHLVFLTVDERESYSMYGWDEQGNRWKVDGNISDFWSCSWVRYTGEPVSGDGYDYAVTATDAWYTRQSDEGLNGETYDSVLYDHDGNGDEEQCFIIPTEQASEGQFCFQVWEDDALLYEALFYTDGGSLNAMAFDYDDGKLVIRAVDWPYGSESWTIDTFRINWQEGGPVVSKVTQ